MGWMRNCRNESPFSLILLIHLPGFPFCSPSLPFGAKSESQQCLWGSDDSFLPRTWDISVGHVLYGVCLDLDSFLANYGLIPLLSQESSSILWWNRAELAKNKERWLFLKGSSHLRVWFQAERPFALPSLPSPLCLLFGTLRYITTEALFPH